MHPVPNCDCWLEPLSEDRMEFDDNLCCWRSFYVNQKHLIVAYSRQQKSLCSLHQKKLYQITTMGLYLASTKKKWIFRWRKSENARWVRRLLVPTGTNTDAPRQTHIGCGRSCCTTIHPIDDPRRSEKWARLSESVDARAEAPWTIFSRMKISFDSYAILLRSPSFGAGK